MDSINIEDLVISLSYNYTKIISITEIKLYPKLYWGGNGVGDRWANKKFNYCVIYSNKKIKNYSENEDDNIPTYLLDNFLELNKNLMGIIGIYVYSKKTENKTRPINKIIHKQIMKMSGVICGSNTDIICDHKNDLYNDERILNQNTQNINDFQPLCNHCNLQKRQINKNERKNGKIYSAKNIERYKKYPFEFPWEKKAFDKTDILCKINTYWYDPIEFEYNIYRYLSFVVPIINEIKNKNKQNNNK